MNMKSDDLERLEESQEMQQLIRPDSERKAERRKDGSEAEAIRQGRSRGEA